VFAWPEREIYPSVRRSFVELRVDERKGKILRFPAALNPVRRLTLLRPGTGAVLIAKPCARTETRGRPEAWVSITLRRRVGLPRAL